MIYHFLPLYFICPRRCYLDLLYWMSHMKECLMYFALAYGLYCMPRATFVAISVGARQHCFCAQYGVIAISLLTTNYPTVDGLSLASAQKASPLFASRTNHWRNVLHPGTIPTADSGVYWQWQGNYSCCSEHRGTEQQVSVVALASKEYANRCATRQKRTYATFL